MNTAVKKSRKTLVDYLLVIPKFIFVTILWEGVIYGSIIQPIIGLLKGGVYTVRMLIQYSIASGIFFWLFWNIHGYSALQWMVPEGGFQQLYNDAASLDVMTLFKIFVFLVLVLLLLMKLKWAFKPMGLWSVLVFLPFIPLMLLLQSSGVVDFTELNTMSYYAGLAVVSVVFGFLLMRAKIRRSAVGQTDVDVMPESEDHDHDN